MEIIRGEGSGILVVKIGGRCYVVSYSEKNSQVYSVLRGDNPRGTGRWMARFSEAGVKYVANGRTRGAAMAAYRRITNS